MKIRKATKKDLNKVLEFMGIRQIKRSDWHINSKKFVSSYITNKHNFFFITVDKNKVVGTINGELWDDKGFAYVGEIVARGKYTNRIINEMFDYFLEFCRTKKVKLINTYVRKSKKKQINTYKNLGMKKVGEYFGYEKRLN